MNVGTGKPLRLALLASFNAGLMPRYLAPRLREHGLMVEFYMPGFDQYRQEVLDEASELYRFSPDIVILFTDGQDLLADLCQTPLDFDEEAWQRSVENAVMEVCALADLVLRRLPGATALVNNLALPVNSGLGLLEYNSPHAVRGAFAQFNLALARAVRRMSRAFVVDYDAMVMRRGYDRWVDYRMWYLGRIRLSQDALEVLAQHYTTYILAVLGIKRKCLVLDLDNTLWGGTIGTDGLASIQLGMEGVGLAYWEFQMEILNLYKRGVLLAINSKNNWDEAVEAIDRHPAMVLRREHFAVIKINWQDKVSNIREIAEELNVGLDALVFIDDDPFEIEWVRSQLPEVQTIQTPDDPSALRQMLLDLNAFVSLSLTDEDRARGEMYRREMQRKELGQTVTSIEEFYRTLGMRATISRSGQLTRKRIAQLTQKTNQFNLTTRRYTEAEIESYEREPRRRVYGLSLADRFGDNGLVGVAITVAEEDCWRIDTLLLSCRVMGRTVETAFLAFLAEQARMHGARSIRGEYVPSAKNAPVREVYARHGFQPEDSDGHWWRLDLRQHSVSYPDCIRIEVDDEVVNGACTSR